MRQVVFGSSPSCDVHVDDPYVSPRHARVFETEDGVRVEDLGSTNGVYVIVQSVGSPVRVCGSMAIFPGDTICLGRIRIPWSKKND